MNAALAINPNNTNALAYLSAIYQRRGQPAEAARLRQRAWETLRGNPTVDEVTRQFRALDAANSPSSRQADK